MSKNNKVETDEPTPNDWIDGKRPEGQYNTLVNMKHNGVFYSTGSQINLEKDVAEKLIADGSIF